MRVNEMRLTTLLLNLCLFFGYMTTANAETSLGEILADIDPKIEDGDRRIVEPRRPWEIQCFELAARDDYCIVTQQHRLSGGDQGLTIGALTVIRRQGGALSMHFMLPNTVSLQKGLVLRMAGRDEITLSYGYCTSELCMAELEVDDELLSVFDDTLSIQVEAMLGMPKVLFTFDIPVGSLSDIIDTLPANE